MLCSATHLPQTLLRRPLTVPRLARQNKSISAYVRAKRTIASLKPLRGLPIETGDKPQGGAMGKARKAASQGNANTQAYIQVLGLGTDTGDSVPSALLFFDHHRFLFNIGEGFQRFCIQHKIKMSRTSGIFATRSNTQGLGGLPGMLLTMADMGAGSGTLGTSGVPMTLKGPPGLKEMTNALRSFVNTRDMNLKSLEFGSMLPPPDGKPELPAVFKNDVVTVTPAVLYPVSKAVQSDSQPRSSSEPADILGAAPQQPPAKRRCFDPAGAPAAANNGTATETTDNGTAAGGTAGTADYGTAENSTANKASTTSSPYDQVMNGPGGLPAASYLCQLPDIPGKFLLHKAEALGVPKGPLYAKLVRGQTIELPSGQTVKPGDVMEVSTPGPLAAVIDVPTLEHLPSFLSHPLLRQCLQRPTGGEVEIGSVSPREAEPVLTGASEPAETASGAPTASTEATTASTEAAEKPLHVAVHLTPKAVADHPKYRAWMKACGSGTQHIMANTVAPGEGVAMMHSAAAIHARLNVLAPTLFPFPSDDGSKPSGEEVQQESIEGSSSDNGSNNSGKAVAKSSNLLRYWLRPIARQGLDSDAIVTEPFNRSQVQAELKETRSDILAAAEAFTAPLKADEVAAVPKAITEAGRDTMEVVFLGTGAAIPAKYRNVTGIYVHLFVRGGMMLDCGEGSFGQLVRRYGWHEARRVVAALECVWISHIHADHHAGLPRLLAVRQEILGPTAEPLLVIGPRPLRRSLAAYAKIEPLLFTYLDNAHTVEGADVPEAVAPHLQAVKERLGLARLQSVKVDHCAHAYGCALTASDAATGGAPWSLVFSGDTRPCPELIEAAKGATLLIHEATFDDELREEALAKKHSLTCEAVACGRDAGVYRTILTHFSQRYAKLPVIDDSFLDSTCIAFDLLTANLADLPAMPRLLPALQLLFKEDEDADDEDQQNGDVTASVHT